MNCKSGTLDFVSVHFSGQNLCPTNQLQCPCSHFWKKSIFDDAEYGEAEQMEFCLQKVFRNVRTFFILNCQIFDWLIACEAVAEFTDGVKGHL